MEEGSVKDGRLMIETRTQKDESENWTREHGSRTYHELDKMRRKLTKMDLSEQKLKGGWR